MNKRDRKKVIGWTVQYCECGCNTHIAVPVTLADQRKAELDKLWTGTFESGGTPRLRTLAELNHA
jgi:hypothetical protein